MMFITQNTTHYEPGCRVALTPKFVRDNGGERHWPVTVGEFLGTMPGGFARVRFDESETTMPVAFEHLMREVL